MMRASANPDGAINLGDDPADLVIYGREDRSNFGFALAVGDVNGSGVGDIIAGAPDLWVIPTNAKALDEGTVFVFYGRSDFPDEIHLADAPADDDTADDDTVVDDDTADDDVDADITIYGEVALPPRDAALFALHFGFSLATGDFDGDCIDDILVGSYPGMGCEMVISKAYAIYGSAGFPAYHIMHMPADAAHIILGEQACDLFGYDVSTGDADGDLLADMLVGAKRWSIEPGGNNYHEGAAFLVLSPDTNDKPVADAGDDQIAAVGDNVQLDGSDSSDPEDRYITYAWTQLEGPTVSLSGADTDSPSFTVPEADHYQFQLIVNDCLQDSDADTVWVHMPGTDDDTTDDDTTDDDADPDDDAAPSGDEEEELPGLFGTGGCGSL